MRILVANRGEIALRIFRTLQEMGVPSVAVYSDADRDAPHVRGADAAYPLGGVTATESYLNVPKLLEVMRASGATAVHPGYGFLSENPAFADVLEAEGVKLIGPSARAMRALGDKVEAKRRMEEAGVPIVPGFIGDLPDPQAAAKAAADVGFPLMVKAAAGGGGKGMRVVHDPEELWGAIEAARREAASAFGDDRVFLERHITRPRHVEIQILGDSHGNVVHLFERECSVQRRHQKIVEESPSPVLTPELRARMGESAVRAAQAVGYENAGTVEFILDQYGGFYFLEVNARLQVEHPITELVTGRDLVRAQVEVARGEPLPFSQEDLRQTGHAVECRVYAEDPERGFLPSIGLLKIYREPDGPGVRVDSGVRAGSEVSVHYDPMLAKVIVWAETRDEALARMQRALSEFVVLGVTTNIPFLRALLAHPAFRAGDLHTHFLEEHQVQAHTPDPSPIALAAAGVALSRIVTPRTGVVRGTSAMPSPWTSAGSWRLGG